MPSARTSTYGERAFSIRAPRLWNSLPLNIKKAGSVDHFKELLKQYLFKLAFDWWLIHSMYFALYWLSLFPLCICFVVALVILLHLSFVFCALRCLLWYFLRLISTTYYYYFIFKIGLWVTMLVKTGVLTDVRGQKCGSRCVPLFIIMWVIPIGLGF